MNKSPLVVSPGLGEDDANQLMILNRIFHLPVVDDSGMIVGLHVAEQLRSIGLHYEVIVIMAGGRGQRLMPLTSDLPKPMLLIKGKPMLEYIILPTGQARRFLQVCNHCQLLSGEDNLLLW